MLRNGFAATFSQAAVHEGRGYTQRAVRRLLASVLTLACIASAVAVVLVVRDGKASRSTSVVKVDLRAGRQVMQGFGSSVRVWSDPHLSHFPNTVVPPAAQAQILAALYRRLGLTRSRQVLDGGIEKMRDGPFDFGGKLGEDQIAYVKKAKPYGLRMFFPGPVYIEQWMTADDAGGYVDYAVKILEYWRSKGVEPPAYALMNEPQFAGGFPPKWMHDVVVGLGRRLKAEGFKTKLVIPDDENPADAYRRAVAVLDDPVARQYVGALAYHIYKGSTGDWIRMRDLASKHRLPVWMTEYWNHDYESWPGALGWAATIHHLITTGGVNAVDYIWGAFGDWVGPDETLIEIKFDNGVYRSFSYSPIYYLTGQWSRFVRPGYQRIAASPESGSALVSAYRGPGKLVVVAVNTSPDTQTVRFTVSGGRLLGKVTAVRTTSSESWRTLPPIAVRRSAFTSVLAPSSATTLVVSRR